MSAFLQSGHSTPITPTSALRQDRTSENRAKLSHQKLARPRAINGALGGQMGFELANGKRRWALTAISVAACILLSGLIGGQANAIPGEPTISIQEHGKARIFVEYMELFRKAWVKLHDGELGSDAAPYNQSALEKASAEHLRRIELCKSHRAELKTESAYAACVITAKRSFASAIELIDTGLTEAIAITLARVGEDTDAGKLTADQARDIYEALDEEYGSIFDLNAELYNDKIGVHLAT
jgi:hypothetical protein